jgi:hypothetical protein
MSKKIASGLISILVLMSCSYSQTRVFQVINQENEVPIPFTLVQLNGVNYSTTIDGFVTLDTLKEPSIHFSQPYFYNLDSIFTTGQDTIIVYLQAKPLDDLQATEPSTQTIIDSVLSHSKENNIYLNKNFRYTSYNKARISTNNIDEAKGMVNKLLGLFAIELKSYDGSHHVLLAESITKRKYVDEFNQKENIIASKISGIDNPKMLALNSQIQSMSVYNKFINVIDKSYVSPVFEGTEKRYNFKLLQKIQRADDDLYVIQFNPNGKLKQVLLTGVLYISSKNWAVESAIIRPDKSSSVQFDVYLNYALKNEVWVPHSFTTRIGLDNVSSKKFQFITRYSTYIYDFEYQASLKKSIWDDITIEFSPTENISGDSLITDNRKEEFSERDQNTYTFYDSVGTLNNIDVAFDFAEHLYEKQIKTKYFNIDLNRAFDYNNYEGFRIGIGANKDIDKKGKLNIGGHMAYGLQDNQAKYGIRGRYKLLPLKKLTFIGGLDNETYESAQSIYSFYRYQYSSEWLRRFSINIMDVAQRYYLGFETSPIKYTSLSFKLMSSKNFTPYNYQYKQNTSQTYRYTDVEIGLRFAFGENQFKLYNNKYKLKSHYPVLWTKLNFGLNNFLGGQYDYVKLDSRIEYTMRSFLLGKGHIQFNFGHAIGELPYFQLFEGYGAEGAAVAHNRFETMGINEFLSSTYANLFLTYEITKLYFRKHPKFRPSIELDYNVGIGSLKNKEDHKNFDFNTMEKSYHETGISIRNLITFKIVAAKIGLGVGNYLRFGPYAYSSFKENYNAKVFLTFAL